MTAKKSARVVALALAMLAGSCAVAKRENVMMAAAKA